MEAEPSSHSRPDLDRFYQFLGSLRSCLKGCLEWWGPYRNLEVHHFLRKGRHLIVKAEFVLAHALGREDKVPLSLLRAI